MDAYTNSTAGVPLTVWGSRDRGSAPRMQAAPGNWDAFRKAYGQGNASQTDYENWNRQQVRENSLASFVDRMAGGDTEVANNLDLMRGQMGDYGGRLNQFLDTAGPQMSTDNRFEQGLSQNERRLLALLDDPDSIKQTAAYKFRVGQGQEAINRSLGAKGMLGSGNRLMELTKYGQDMGSQEYDAQAKRLQDLLGMYSGAYVGDKNANTGAFTAESADWGRRGALLSDVFNNTMGATNAATKVSGDQRVNWANAWTNQAPKAYQEQGNIYAPGGLTRQYG